MDENFPIRVPAVLRIDSDWASVVLATSNALIERDPTFSYSPDTHFTGTQLFVGQQYSFRFERKDVPFIISANGPPIDIITAHGDASGGTEPGNVTVDIGPINLFNNDNNVDGVNAKVFPQVPIPIDQ